MEILVSYEIKKFMNFFNQQILILHVLFTKNSILCIIINTNAKILAWSNVGNSKIKGSKKVTAVSINSFLKRLYFHNKIISNSLIYIKFKGFNKYKNYFFKTLKFLGYNIIFIEENLNLPYNGCKKKKTRKI